MKNTLLTIALLFCLFSIQAQDTTYISLDKLLQQVETNYPSIIQYQYNIQSIQAKADGAKSWMPPTFSTGIMRFPYNVTMIKDKNDPMNQAGIAFSLEQMIPNQSKLNAKKSYISSLAEIEKSKSEWTKNELRREAKILYYNRFVTEKKQLVLKESEEILQLLITTSEEKFSNNQSQLQTIYKAKARLAELNNMLLMLNGFIAESNIGLNILMVRDVNTSFRIDTLVVPKNYSINLADTSSVSNRSDITALNKYIQSMKLEQKVMKIGNRPDFGVRAEHMQMFGMPNQWSVMGMMTIPIVPWSSKMYRSETKSIGFQIQSMELEKQTMELMAKRMLSDKLTMLSYENAQYQSYTKNIIPAYEKNLQANILAYKQNTGDYFVLLDAWEMLLMKKLEAYDKLFNILKLEAEYEYEKEIK
ncbi:TolC family protein [Candidatus Pollutiaquabacter sp.]|uniref:TolC family protein n=1 Tax=Candidatus Pollutiaquabacter sp. TaxID=3416354 RepID=UPI003C98C609|nr:TolC family protein [Bacteroidota bacterium]